MQEDISQARVVRHFLLWLKSSIWVLQVRPHFLQMKADEVEEVEGFYTA